MRAVCLLLFVATPAFAQDGYRLPPQAIVDVLTAPPPPSVGVSPDKQWLVLASSESMPSIAVRARPVLRLAGRRFDPRTHGPQRGARTTGFTLVAVADGSSRALAVPAGADLGAPVWAADGRRFAFTNTEGDAIELWIADVATAQARRVDSVRLNAILGAPVRWMPDQETLLCRLVAGPSEPPAPPAAPTGPAMQESAGVKAPVRTHQDLLQNEFDAALFEHHATSQLARVDAASGRVTLLGAPALYTGAAPSPDGTLLLVTALHRPFSYLVPAHAFPRRIALLDADGKEVARIADLPLAEDVPIQGVPKGPRDVEWVPTADHELVWVEALDGGDPKAKVPHRDLLRRRDARAAEAADWMRLEHRYTDVAFAAGGDLALVSEYDRDRRWSRTWRVDPRGEREPVLWFDRSTQDAYGDPGKPLTTVDARGSSVLLRHGDVLFLAGQGATESGDRPFLDRHDLATGQVERLFRCREETYEAVVALLDHAGERALVHRESATQFPNWFVRDLRTGEERALTHLEDPTAAITGKIEKRLLTYARDDGVGLSGTLYLPPAAPPDARLPLFVWAYPREFDSADNAGQVRGSPHRYTRMSGPSPLLLTLAGYAVLYDAAMPIVGPVETANDTFVPQLVADAQAAIDTCVELGIADRDRCAIGGHSYGAFMTANLLAHSDLFRAGVARSGAYNRTLTPFGFQNERRTLWEAADTYAAMSPFMHAPKIDEPLLLIHGEADDNQGTFPLQSQRLYHAIKGVGGTARLVMLPCERHGYEARESVLHCVAETVDWLDRWVKNAGARAE
jgi:dipeptidyl aminopeptidase/acylaminoacyl peptidase